MAKPMKKPTSRTIKAPVKSAAPSGFRQSVACGPAKKGK